LIYVSMNITEFQVMESQLIPFSKKHAAYDINVMQMSIDE
jgi:hypothetical protein